MNKYLSLVVLLLTCVVQAAPEMKGHPEELKSFLYPNKRVITIRSSAEEKAYSDKAIISLVITTEEDMLADAIGINSALRITVTDALTEAGLKPEDINTSKFSTSPQFGWFGDEPDSFEIVNRMAIRISNEKQLSAIAAISDKNKEISLSDTEYKHSLKEQFEQTVKQKALEKVMQQKKFYETTLGLKLKAVGFRDFDVVQTGTRGAQAFEKKIVITGSRVKRTSASSSKPQVRSVTVPQTFDEVVYTATISVDFEISK